MLSFQHDADTAGLQVHLQPVGDLSGESFLYLQPRCELVDDAGELGESEDPLAGEVGDVRDAVKWQQVVFAEGVEGDVARDHELVVPFMVGEGGEVERLGGEHLGVHARHSAGVSASDPSVMSAPRAWSRCRAASSAAAMSTAGRSQVTGVMRGAVLVAFTSFPLVGRVSADGHARRHPPCMGYPSTCALTYAVPSLMPGAKNDTPRALLSAPAAV